VPGDSSRRFDTVRFNPSADCLSGQLFICTLFRHDGSGHKLDGIS